VLTDDGEIEIAVPRDRAGSFEPQLIANGQISSCFTLQSKMLACASGGSCMDGHDGPVCHSFRRCVFQGQLADPEKRPIYISLRRSFSHKRSEIPLRWLAVGANYSLSARQDHRAHPEQSEQAISASS